MRCKADIGESFAAAINRMELWLRSLIRLSDGPRYYWRPRRSPTPTQASFFDDWIVRLLGKFPIHGRLAP